MENKSITALVCTFARAYHAQNYIVKVFDDTAARDLFYHEEYEEIASNLIKSIGFFNPGFKGVGEEALRYMVNSYLSPNPVGRSAFTEEMLKEAVQKGAEQYLMIASGYDTFAYRQPQYAEKLHVF